MKELNERILSRKLVERFHKLLPHYVTFKHTDMVTSSVPDISTTGDGMTTWIEVKYLNPILLEREKQALIMRRLLKQGSALYVLFDETRHEIRAIKYGEVSETIAFGFKIDAVVEYVHAIHERMRRVGQ